MWYWCVATASTSDVAHSGPHVLREFFCLPRDIKNLREHPPAPHPSFTYLVACYEWQACPCALSHASVGIPSLGTWAEGQWPLCLDLHRPLAAGNVNVILLRENAAIGALPWCSTPQFWCPAFTVIFKIHLHQMLEMEARNWVLFGHMFSSNIKHHP